MIIINQYTNKNTLQSVYKVHYIQHSKIINSTDKLSEKTFQDFKKKLLQGHKLVMLSHVASAAALDNIIITNINQLEI